MSLDDEIRTHDKFYLDENRKNNPKEYFKFINNNIQVDLNNKDVLDVGCATGDFLWYLSNLYRNANFSAIDVDQELIDRAKVEVSAVKDFYCLDITKDEIPGEYDFIFMNGVHSIFSEISSWLDPLVGALKANSDSRLYVFGLFNPDNLDVIVRSRPSSSSDAWETGWNLVSKKSVYDYCNRKNWVCDFLDFNIEIDIKKNASDPLRSYTVPTLNGDRILKNGLQLIHTLSLATIRMK